MIKLTATDIPLINISGSTAYLYQFKKQKNTKGLHLNCLYEVVGMRRITHLL